MKALSVHGGCERFDRISDNDGAIIPDGLVGVDAEDATAALVGLEAVDILRKSPRQPWMTGDGDDSRDDFRDAVECLRKADFTISSLDHGIDRQALRRDLLLVLPSRYYLAIDELTARYWVGQVHKNKE